MVEWKKIGDVCDVFAGGDLPSTYIKGNMPSEECIFPIYSNGVEEKSLYGFSDSYRVDKASITISARGTIGYHCIRKPYFTPIVRLITLIPKNIKNLNLSYLNEVLFNSNIDGTKGGIPQLTVPTVSRLLIPIPSIHEQERIVGILNTFTSSIDNLKQQIAQRRKQYEYYRDQLLDLEGKEGVEMKTLGELCELVTKQTGFDYSGKIKPALLTNPQEGALPFLQTKNFSGRKFDYNTDYYVPERIVEQYPKIVLNKQCLLFSIVGASIGNIGLFPGSRRCFLGGAICVLKFLDGINIHYVYEVMSSWYGQKQIREKTKGAGQATITVEDVRKFVIPYPNSEIQTRIVSILDTFEASIQNLEAQLKEREKQYEYYRNKLLTFK